MQTDLERNVTFDCRYYLLFKPGLRRLLEQWNIGQLGPSAYRTQFCSRQLVAQFSYVWITIVLVAAFIDPALRLIRGHLTTERNKDASEESDDKTQDSIHTSTQKHVQIATQEVACACSTMLTTYVFGVLVPPLLLLSPLSSWLNLCALRRNVEHGAKRRSFGQRIATQVMVHTPLTAVMGVAHVGHALVMITIFWDLQFSLGPIGVYTALYVTEIASMQWLHCLWKNQTSGTVHNTTTQESKDQTVTDFSR